MNSKKGKKINQEFVNEFITKSISDGICSSEEIISQAKKKILEIDKKLVNINALKEKRSNLLDVVISFEVKKEDRSNQKLDLAIMSLPKNEVIKYLIDTLDYKGIHYSELKRRTL